MNKTIRQILQRPVAILAWSAALLLGGTWAATNVPLEWSPTVELPRVNITSSWSGASPRSVERYITAPIERAVAGVKGTEQIESTSEEGRSSITLEVSRTVNLSLYTAEISERLARLADELPERVHPRLTKHVPEQLREQQGFMTLQLVGPLSPDRLREIADEDISSRLQSIGGVGGIEVRGGSQRELLIRLRPGRMDAYDVEVGQVRAALTDAMSNEAYGRLHETGQSRLLMRPSTADIGRLEDTAVAYSDSARRIIRLADIADAQVGPAPLRSISRIDGDPVVTLTVERAAGSHMLATAAAVHELVGELRDRLPQGTRLLVADDQSENVREQLRDLTWRGGLGLLLVILVLAVMLRSARAIAIVLFSVSVSIAVALALLGPLGLTLNLITIAGLVLVFGLLIDNSVVVTEQLMLQRSRRAARPGAPPEAEDAALTTRALRTVWLPLVGGTLSTMAVLVPLVYLSGELRALFLPFGVLVSLTLAASLISAAVVVPVLGRFLPPPRRQPRAPRGLRTGMQAPYKWTARFPKTTLAALALLLGIPLWLLPAEITAPEEGWSRPAAGRAATVYNVTLGSDLVQDARDYLDPALGGLLYQFSRDVQLGERWAYDRRPEVSVRITLPSGGSVTQTDSLIRPFEQTALASPVVARTILSITSRQTDRGPTASLRVQFKESSLTTAAPYVLREELISRAIGLGGVSISVRGLLPQGYYSGSGAGISGISVSAYGPNYEDLEDLAERFARRARAGSRRVAAVHTNVSRYSWRSSDPRHMFRLSWPPEAALRTGLKGEHITNLLRPVLARRQPVGRIDLTSAGYVPVRLMVAGANQTDIRGLMGQIFQTSDTTKLRLEHLAEMSVEEVPPTIRRSNQQYERTITVDYRGPGRLGNEYVNGVLEGMATPPGYRLERQTYTFFTEDVQELFGWLILATIGLVFLITAAVFESWWLPLVVMLSVPLAMVGVSAGFLSTGASVAEGAFIGGVLMVGIAVNDSVLLTDRYRQLAEKHPHRSSGLLARLAVRERLRPMWTTTLTSIATLVPLMIFPDDTAFWMGLSVTVVGGLLASTVLGPAAAVAMVSLQR